MRTDGTDFRFLFPLSMLILIIAGCDKQTDAKAPLEAGQGFQCLSDAPLDPWVRAVDSRLTEPGDGSSWCSGFKTIQEAMDDALASQGDSFVPEDLEIWVATGTYSVHQTKGSDTLALRPGIHLYGGFVGDETDRARRDPRTNRTTITGENPETGEKVYHVITGSDDSTLDGFTITGGHAAGGRFGAGMYNHNASPTVVGCTFKGNISDFWGGAVFNSFSDAVFEGCTFTDNEAAKEGGAIYNQDSAVLIENSLFYNNSSGTNGGAVANFSHATPEIINCTFVANSAQLCGGGISNWHTSSSLVVNTILWENDAPEEAQICSLHQSDPSEVSYSDIQGGYDGEGNIDEDPAFVDPSTFDYHLTEDSPCIDAGFDDDAPQFDREGRTRVGTADMGAFEFQGERR